MAKQRRAVTFNIKGVIIVLVSLLALHLAVGFWISPMIAQAVIKNIDETSDLRLSAGKISVWPLTFGVQIDGLKLFDTADTKRRIILIEKIKGNISPVQLLAGRLVMPSLEIDGARICLAGEPDPGFDVPTAGSRKTNLDLGLAFNKWKSDWGQNKEEIVAKVQKFLKEDCSQENLDKYKLRFKQAKSVVRKSVKKRPKGRIVEFKIPADSALIQVRKVSFNNGFLSASDAGGNALELAGLNAGLTGASYDQALGGLNYDSISAAADIKANGTAAGKLELRCGNRLDTDKRRQEYDLSLKGADLEALRFFYKSVLPVDLQKGKLDLESRTVFLDDALDSRNSLTLRDHSFGGQEYAKVLDKINPLAMSFKVGGTVLSPDFKDLDSSFNKLIQENAKEVIKETVKEEASKALDKYLDENKDKASSDTSAIVDSLGGLFKQ